jgi:outer membrane protein assembly factor BamA
MQKKRTYHLWLLVAFVCCGYHLCAQGPVINDPPISSTTSIINTDSSSTPTAEASFTVRTIFIEGNRKTKPNIILREIPFKSGHKYELQEIVKKFEQARRQLMNTALFHEVVVALKSFEGYDVDVLVLVRERWYVFPLPYFKPVDRNLNQWLVEQKGSLKRVNYGAKLLYNNFTGNNDKLRFWLISGYTKQLSMSYDRLYIDKKMRWGMNVGFAMGKNREINYNTIEDKQVFLKDEQYLRNFFNASIELTYRKAINTRHRFGIGYVQEKLADTVIKLNPGYFLSGSSKVTFPELYYIMTYYNLDYIPYPTKGYAAEISASKRGFSKEMNVWQLAVKGSGNWPTGKRSFFNLNVFGTIKAPFSQPYYNRRLLGYSDVFLQGYEYYVIDGVAGGYAKASFARKLFKFNIGIPGTKKIAPKRIPFNIYGRVYGNAGYIYNPDPIGNFLSNKMLYSTGFGVDITSLYDFTLKLEWSFNQLGQNGLFLHRKTIF